MDEAMRKSIDEIKTELANGGARGIVSRSRRTGKTSALLEFVHENDPGNMIVVSCNSARAASVKFQYKDLFPDDVQPMFTTVHCVNNRDVRGTTRRWVSDEVWPGAVVRKAPSYEFAQHLGTVGTPMCMDAVAET